MGILRDTFELLNDAKNEVGFNLDNIGSSFTQRDKTYSSISRRAAQGTMQFPHIVSRAIGPEAVQRIVNASERNDASFAQIVLTMNPQLDTSKGDIIEYLKDFHQNTDTEDDTIDTLSNMAQESTIRLQVFQTSDQGLSILKEELAEFGADFRAGTLNKVVAAKYIKDNHFILPITEAQRKADFEKSLAAVIEAKGKPSTPAPANTKIDVNINNGGGGSKSHMPEGGRENIVMQNILRDNDVRKSNELVPTLLHIRVIASDSTGKSDINKYVDFIVGVKATIHPVDSEQMIENLVDACRNHDGFFKFIKWTTGEISFLTDFLLNMKDSKRDIAKQASGASPWWNRLRHLAVLAGVKKSLFIRRKILPNATIIVTQEEVDYIKNQYGFDLMNPGFVKKIMEKFFLLCFIVVDDAIEVAHFKYDGQSSYQTVSYTGLEKENANSARQFKDILKAVQRI